MTENTQHDAFNWAMANLTSWVDHQKNIERKDFSVARLDNYMTELLGRSYQEVWDYFDVYGYIVYGQNNRIVIKNNQTGEFKEVCENTLCSCCASVNDWIIEHYRKGSSVFVVLAL
jgi:hypothetical protein